ncbi:MAG: P1 family peptidase, partial [Acidimicrobiia bacterium]
VVACNAAGDVIGAGGDILAGSAAPAGTASFPGLSPLEHTTLVVVATDARLSKTDCRLAAVSAHDGLARAIRPAHTRYDGDAAFVLASGVHDAHPDRVREAAADVVAQAVRAAVAARPGR